MKEPGMENRMIAVSDLLLNPENPRYDPVGSQREVINTMILDLDKKLLRIATHILKMGVNPNKRVIVKRSETSKDTFIVLDGNGRLLVLKLLLNPNLIENNPSLKEGFVRLHNEYGDRIPKTLDCNIFDDPKQADEWIRLEHTGENDGVGTKLWDGTQTARFRTRINGKPSASLQIIDMLKASPDVPAEVKAGLVRGFRITTLDRMISNPEVREFFGIEINEQGNVISSIAKGEVVKGLTELVTRLLDPKVTAYSVYSKEAQKKFLDMLNPAARPNLKNKAPRVWQANSSEAPASQPPTKQQRSTDRKHLIPRSPRLEISNPRVNEMYLELVRLDVTKFPNAAAISLRVFVELSCDCFIEKHSITVSDRRHGLIRDQPCLAAKVETVADYLKEKGLVTDGQLKGIRVAIGDKHNVLSIDTFHNYVHNLNFSPTDRGLKTAWNNIEKFMTVLWNNVQ